ncbi:hypothetical protein KIL84_006230 [Mauremys mutica]|uniref:Uncharacterized protein n=1 Tax=Mauremys mutica TaxID=74926 RepID=A0A9D3X0Q4_9SAUR|nr:hypothetical protein KIL84_006230 [Mauremys mutica]
MEVALLQLMERHQLTPAEDLAQLTDLTRTLTFCWAGKNDDLGPDSATPTAAGLDFHPHVGTFLPGQCKIKGSEAPGAGKDVPATLQAVEMCSQEVTHSGSKGGPGNPTHLWA